MAILGILQGLGLAVLLTEVNLIRQTAFPHDAILGVTENGMTFHDRSRPPKTYDTPGLLIYRFDAPIFFGNANYFHERVIHFIDTSPYKVRWLLLDCEAISSHDSTGAKVLKNFIYELEEKDIVLATARLKGPIRETRCVKPAWVPGSKIDSGLPQSAKPIKLTVSVINCRCAVIRPQPIPRIKHLFRRTSAMLHTIAHILGQCMKKLLISTQILKIMRQTDGRSARKAVQWIGLIAGVVAVMMVLLVIGVMVLIWQLLNGVSLTFDGFNLVAAMQNMINAMITWLNDFFANLPSVKIQAPSISVSLAS